MRPWIVVAGIVGCTAEVSVSPPDPDTTDDLVVDGVGVWSREGEEVHRGAVLASESTARGERWTVVVPGRGRGEVTIRNAPPDVSAVVPAVVDSATTVEPAVRAFDPDGDAVDLTVGWSTPDGRAHDGPALRPPRTAPGDVWTWAVTADDGTDTSVTRGEVRVVDGGPRVISGGITPAGPVAGDVLSGQATAEDPEGRAVRVTWRWFVDGELAGEEERFAGVLEDGQSVAAEATPWAGDVAGPSRAFSTTVGGRPPVVDPPQIVPASPTVLGATCTPVVTATDGDDVTTSVVWWSQGRVVARGPNLPPGTVPREGVVACEVTASDHDGTSSARREVVVGDAPPDPPTAVAIVPGEPTSADPLSVDGTFTDPDRDQVVPDVLWTLPGGVEVVGNTLDPVHTRRGDTVTATVYATSGAHAVGPAADTIVIGNAPPTGTLTVDAPVLVPGETVRASLTVVDADGDDVDVSWIWELGRAVLSLSDTLEVPAGLTDGETIRVTATLDDGHDFAFVARALEVTTARRGLRVTPAAPLDRDPVVCAPWSVDDVGSPDVGWTGPSDVDAAVLPFRATAAGDTWTCEATWPDDTTASAVVDVGRGPLGGNVLVVVADDLGVDKVGAYGLHPDAPPTPTLDALAAEGIRFQHAYAAPTCSPARAQLLTGRHARRTGIGRTVVAQSSEVILDPAEEGLGEVLDGGVYEVATAVVGKWHLGSHLLPGGYDHPAAFGFDRWSLVMGNLPGNVNPAPPDTDIGYFAWEQVDDGVLALQQGYLTTAQVDRTLALVDELPEPWVVTLLFTAPHTPVHDPPDALHTQDLGIWSTKGERYDAMVEAMDTEIGRLLASLDPDVRADTTVILMGDNGTPGFATTAPFDRLGAKTTLHEGGVRVPFLVAGPHVVDPGRVVDHLVHITDVLPTVADLAGVDVATLDVDGVSLVPFLRAETPPVWRDHVHTEAFAPNGVDLPRVDDRRAVRDGRWRLLKDATGLHLYDVSASGGIADGDDLWTQALGPEGEAARDRLVGLLKERERALGR